MPRCWLGAPATRNVHTHHTMRTQCCHAAHEHAHVGPGATLLANRSAPSAKQRAGRRTTHVAAPPYNTNMASPNDYCNRPPDTHHTTARYLKRLRATPRLPSRSTARTLPTCAMRALAASSMLSLRQQHLVDPGLAETARQAVVAVTRSSSPL